MKEALFTWAYIQSFLIGGLLLVSVRNRTNKYLSIFFLIVAVKVLGQYLMRLTSVKFTFSEIVFIADVLDFIEPVILLFYLRLLFDFDAKLNKRIFFTPGALMTAFSILFVVIGPNGDMFDSYIGTWMHQTVLGCIVAWKLFILIQVHKIIYGKHKVAVQSKLEKFLMWPKMLGIFLAVSMIVSFGNLAYHLVLGGGAVNEPIRQIIEYNYIIYNCALVLATGFFFFDDPKLFKGMILRKGSSSNEDFPGGDYYFERLNKLLNEEKIHLDSELTEHIFAEKLELQPYLLSKLVNQYLGKSFSELINEYRIEEAKRILSTEKGKEMTIYAVAVDSGFRSESVFYVNFKKTYGNYTYPVQKGSN